MSGIACRITELREKNKLTQAQVAKLLGVTPALISAYEKAERNPSLEKLVHLANLFHTSTDYILGRTQNCDSSILIDLGGLSDTQIALIRELVDEFKK